MKQKNKTIIIDGIDKKILRALTTDARTPILEIARNVGISGAAIHQRLRKLEKSKLISGSKFIINPEVLGFTTLAFVGIYLDKVANTDDVVRALKRVPEVLECHYTTGKFTIFIKILSKNNEDLMKVLDAKVKVIKGVSKFESMISLDTSFLRQIHI